MPAPDPDAKEDAVAEDPSPPPSPKAPGFRSSITPLLEKTREWMDRWEPVRNPQGPADWFAGAGNLPTFDAAATPAFSPANAWWLAELCRIAYTPDEKEAPRRWHKGKPSRHDFFERGTPFREILNLHKTGCHASLYRLAGDSPGAVLCFRGTSKLRQWIANLDALPVSWPRAGDGGATCVHQGFQLLFDRVWPLIEPSMEDHKEGPLILTGHSLGGAFATLAAAILSARPMTALVTFGSPRVGNQVFTDRLAGLPVHRVVNHHDIVPLLPQRDARLGKRDFQHAGDLYRLGEKPGVLHSRPGPEPTAGDEPAESAEENPVALLTASLGNPDPPRWLLDHSLKNYAEKLRTLAAESKS